MFIILSLSLFIKYLIFINNYQYTNVKVRIKNDKTKLK